MPYIGNSPKNNVRGRFYYTATAAQTVFSGADSNGKTLAYQDGGYVDVYLNGVLLQDTIDYTATTKTSVTLTSGATAGDLVEIIAYGIFSVGDTVSAANGGTFKNNIDVVGTVTSDGLAVDGDVTFYEDTGTTAKFFWDASAERLELGDSVSLRGGSSSRMVLAETTAAAINWLEIQSSTTGRTGVIFSDGNTGNYGLIDYDHTDDHLKILTASSEAMRIDSSGDVDIGSTGGGAKLAVAGAVGTQNGSAAAPSHTFYGDNDSGMFRVAADTLGFSTAGAERMRISSAGTSVVFFGTNDASPYNNSAGSSADNGVVIDDGRIWVARYAGTPIDVNRTGQDGGLISFRRDGIEKGFIDTDTSFSTFQIHGNGTSGWYFGANFMLPLGGTNVIIDNTVDLGNSSVRFDDIYATNGTIQTSDQNEKQQIASLTDAEITAAKAISKLFKTFKWKDKVAEKGDAARTHAGVIAQDVQQAMTDAGLDAGNYAFFISSTWWETQTEVPAVAEELDEDGNVITEAKEAYTRTDTYATLEEAPEGATERTRLGIRYPELLAFIGAATEQRLASIEARLDALEA